MENREHVTVGRGSPSHGPASARPAPSWRSRPRTTVETTSASRSRQQKRRLSAPAAQRDSSGRAPARPSKTVAGLPPRRAAGASAQSPHGVPLPTSLGWYVTNTAEAVLAALCIRRFVKPELLFTSMSGMMAFIGFGVILAPVVTSFVDAGIVVGTARGEDYWIRGAPGSSRTCWPISCSCRRL